MCAIVCARVLFSSVSQSPVSLRRRSEAPLSFSQLSCSAPCGSHARRDSRRVRRAWECQESPQAPQQHDRHRCHRRAHASPAPPPRMSHWPQKSRMRRCCLGLSMALRSRCDFKGQVAVGSHGCCARGWRHGTFPHAPPGIALGGDDIATVRLDRHVAGSSESCRSDRAFGHARESCTSRGLRAPGCVRDPHGCV